MSALMRTLARLLLLLCVIAIAGWGGWVALTSPGNPVMRWFGGSISEVDARVVTGPYPLESDFRRLQDHGVIAIISLLDPDIPYEKVLLEREKALAPRYGLAFYDFPMKSILGHPFGTGNEASAEAAARTILGLPGRVYLHCYLGLHRTKVVGDLLAGLGGGTAVYTARTAERSALDRTLDAADAAYAAGHFQEALDLVAQLGEPDERVLALTGWAAYRLGRTGEAEVAFSALARRSPGAAAARVGLGYTALRRGDLAEAERQFEAVLAGDARDVAALVGLGIVRHRQDRDGDAEPLLRRALALDPDNGDAREALAGLHPPTG